MRILLFTGKGGVGKTTIAAGTAVKAARTGQRTLILSTDAAHSLADCLGLASGTSAAEPLLVEPDLWVLQIDAQERLEKSWADIQRYLVTVLDASGVDPITAAELTVVPGAEEVLALLEVRDQVTSGRWDVVVVDCAPTAETLRLLALPEALRWYMKRVFPVERAVVRTLRPVLAKATGVPMPGETVFDAIERLHQEMAEVQALLSGPEASVRLVLTPEQVVLAEARRTLTTLSLFGYCVDGVVINRVFPDGGADAWRAGWVAAQREVLIDVADSFGSLPQWQAAYLATEPVGPEALVAFADSVYADGDPLERGISDGGAARAGIRFESTTDGTLVRCALPFVTRSEVDLMRHGEELVITVGTYRRLITLPTGVSGMKVASAGVREGELQIRFVAPESGPSGAPSGHSGQHTGGQDQA